MNLTTLNMFSKTAQNLNFKEKKGNKTVKQNPITGELTIDAKPLSTDEVHAESKKFVSGLFPSYRKPNIAPWILPKEHYQVAEDNKSVTFVRKNVREPGESASDTKRKAVYMGALLDGKTIYTPNGYTLILTNERLSKEEREAYLDYKQKYLD